MRIGVFTPLLSNFPLPEVLSRLKAQGIDTVELATGNYPGDAHCKLAMLENKAQLEEFRRTIADHGFTISALSCHGNPLHPDPARASHDQNVNKETILLAEKLGVPVVVDFSGCPGDSPKAQQPNWVRRIGESIDYAETDPTALTFLAVLRQGLATVGRARETICTSTFDEPQATSTNPIH